MVFIERQRFSHFSTKTFKIEPLSQRDLQKISKKTHKSILDIITTKHILSCL